MNGDKKMKKKISEEDGSKLKAAQHPKITGMQKWRYPTHDNFIVDLNAKSEEERLTKEPREETISEKPKISVKTENETSKVKNVSPQNTYEMKIPVSPRNIKRSKRSGKCNLWTGVEIFEKLGMILVFIFCIAIIILLVQFNNSLEYLNHKLQNCTCSNFNQTLE